ncbi:hypothetical protein P170DRAFT_410544 [Aspergillus steynii IBT 23096]|uniref:SUR7-domain-containing protein n=1 Tax=Aspergillus steynii IBT 23096 TaxID=1392250 RepID=A0A2I2G577_9EURO|nr:uncharacterized protein P170DRAFT_410544 [Aspergillus steynii IBT 23096]PLB48024.1 hypothetical protein P170DRAFT_410544 [Aspergillus steynii IBT 23096]
MGRLIGLLPTVAAFVAFILSILCLFAGTQKNLLSSADILTLYTSTVGNGTEAHDFYSIHVMTYCEGFMNSKEERNLTGCSKRSMLFSFDPSEVLLEETGNTTSLDRLGWPSAISEDFRAFKITYQSLGVFYCIGVGLAGLAILVRLFFMLFRRTRQSAIELASLLIGFVMISIASIITTVIMFQFVNLVNYHGEASDVSAKHGREFLAMSWAAAGLLLVGSVASLAMVLVDRGRAEEEPPSPPPRPDTPKSEMAGDAESIKSAKSKY